MFSESQTAEAVSRLHSSLFHLLVVFANEQSLDIQVGTWVLLQLK